MRDPLAQETAHRPWPLPGRAWCIAMRWEDLLFAHWPLPANALRKFIPPGLHLDIFDGYAWLGVVPFRMCDTRLRGLPSLPGAGAFPELNVRTYVTHNEKPGVWFFSLDAASRLAVRIARRFFHLPYYDAQMAVSTEAGSVVYESRRSQGSASPAELQIRYRPMAAVFASKAGTLEHFLTERYCLYSVDAGGRLWRGAIHHAPWPLQPAQAEIALNTMARPLGVELADPPAHLCFARSLQVVAWRIRQVNG